MVEDNWFWKLQF